LGAEIASQVLDQDDVVLLLPTTSARRDRHHILRTSEDTISQARQEGSDLAIGTAQNGFGDLVSVVVNMRQAACSAIQTTRGRHARRAVLWGSRSADRIDVVWRLRRRVDALGGAAPSDGRRRQDVGETAKLQADIYRPGNGIIEQAVELALLRRRASRG